MAFLVDPRLWDDAKFLRLVAPARYLFAHLLTTPLRTSLPGLIKSASVSALQDGVRFSSELVRDTLIAFADAAASDRLRHLLHEAANLVMQDDRIGYELTRNCLQALCDVGVAEYDASRRVIRLPNAPRHNYCKNPNVLRGWFRAWRDVPDCELKYVHLETLRDTIPLPTPAWEDAWADGFGSVNVSTIRSRQSGQLPLALNDSPNDSYNHSGDPDPDPDHRSRSGSHDSPNSLVNDSERDNRSGNPRNTEEGESDGKRRKSRKRSGGSSAGRKGRGPAPSSPANSSTRGSPGVARSARAASGRKAPYGME